MWHYSETKPVKHLGNRPASGSHVSLDRSCASRLVPLRRAHTAQLHAPRATPQKIQMGATHWEVRASRSVQVRRHGLRIDARLAKSLSTCDWTKSAGPRSPSFVSLVYLLRSRIVGSRFTRGHVEYGDRPSAVRAALSDRETFRRTGQCCHGPGAANNGNTMRWITLGCRVRGGSCTFGPLWRRRPGSCRVSCGTTWSCCCRRGSAGSELAARPRLRLRHDVLAPTARLERGLKLPHDAAYEVSRDRAAPGVPGSAGSEAAVCGALATDQYPASGQTAAPLTRLKWPVGRRPPSP